MERLGSSLMQFLEFMIMASLLKFKIAKCLSESFDYICIEIY